MTKRTYTYGTPAERQLASVLNAKGNVSYRAAELADAQATLAEAEALDPRLDEFESSLLYDHGFDVGARLLHHVFGVLGE